MTDHHRADHVDIRSEPPLSHLFKRDLKLHGPIKLCMPALCITRLWIMLNPMFDSQSKARVCRFPFPILGLRDA